MKSYHVFVVLTARIQIDAEDAKDAIDLVVDKVKLLNGLNDTNLRVVDAHTQVKGLTVADRAARAPKADDTSDPAANNHPASWGAQ